MEETETIEVEASHGGSAIGTGTITIGKEVSRDPPTVSITPAAVRVSEGEPAVFTLTRANDDTEKSAAADRERFANPVRAGRPLRRTK